MSRRHAAFISLILLLLVANIWYWWPRAPETHRMESSSAVRRFQIEDFELKIPQGVDDKYARPRRDLFQPKAVVTRRISKKTNSPPAPPPKTPEQLEEEAARAELAQIKLVGVVFRGDRGQAFLTKGDQLYLAFPGDKVGGRFTVEKVATDAVQLNDPNTNVTGRIPISGNP
jgi:Tfp pilus assembly protein PilP